MKLSELQTVKRWLVAHRSNHPVEYNAWDTVLMLWIAGLMGEPASLLLGQPTAAIGCVALVMMPTVYVRARRRLHRAGRLRCDWLGAVSH